MEETFPAQIIELLIQKLNPGDEESSENVIVDGELIAEVPDGDTLTKTDQSEGKLTSGRKAEFSLLGFFLSIPNIYTVDSWAKKFKHYFEPRATQTSEKFAPDIILEQKIAELFNLGCSLEKKQIIHFFPQVGQLLINLRK